MTQLACSNKLNETPTSWTEVARAHGGDTEDVHRARHALLARYSGAVNRYLCGALRDASEAADVYQEFALRFLRGDFHRAREHLGRFRDFLKTALIRLVNRHKQKLMSGPQSLAIDLPDPSPAELDQAEEAFARDWRAELLARTWQALERIEQESGRPVYQTLKLRVEHPTLSHEERARMLSERLGRPVSVAAYRQTLHRTREVFATLLRNEVVLTLNDPTPDEIEQELADLRLLEYCRLVPRKDEGK